MCFVLGTHSKQDRTKRLRQRAADRNKDKFYSGMNRERMGVCGVNASLGGGSVDAWHAWQSPHRKRQNRYETSSDKMMSGVRTLMHAMEMEWGRPLA